MPIKRTAKPSRTKKAAPAKKKILRAPLKKRSVPKRRTIAAKRRTPSKARATITKVPGEKLCGTITHYYPKIQVAVVKLTNTLNTNDSIHLKGHSTDFIQPITSMQLDHEAVTIAKKGQEIGLQVSSRVREKDLVFRIAE
jgi:hypothetical protein